MTWGPFGMTWDAQWSPKEDLTLLQARPGETKGTQVSPQEALTLFTNCYELRERLHGPEHVDTLVSLSEVACGVLLSPA